MSNLPAMPPNFAKRIHQALRAWHDADQTKHIFNDLRLARQDLTPPSQSKSRLITNQILLGGLEGLKQINPEGAELLERRFLNQETALEIAHRLNLSEDVIFQRQRTAIAQLAQLIWEQEQALGQQHLRRIEARLDPPTYTQLFGVADKLAQLRALLEDKSAPWLIALEGMGGIGKTSLADMLVRKLAGWSYFYDIGWVSARQYLFRLSGEIEPLSARLHFTLAEVVDRLIDQFDLSALRRQADPAKLAGLKDFLQTQPCLVVVDNLETAADYRALVAQLRDFTNPSKFLLTTRTALHDVNGVYGLTLRELSPADTLALIRYEAEMRGLSDVVGASEAELTAIYNITGGNPLATKLMLGQIHTLSLSQALDLFKTVRGKPVTKLLAYLYDSAWQSLDSPSHRVLQAMLLVSDEGGRLEQIAAAAELDEAETADCLQRLATLSLINVAGNLQEKRYALHQLTQTYVAQQPLDDG